MPAAPDYGAAPGIGKSGYREIRITHGHQVQPVGRRGLSSCGAVAGIERHRNVIRRPPAGSDAFERADDVAHLVMQERSGMSMYVNLFAIALNIQDIHRLDR